MKKEVESLEYKLSSSKMSIYIVRIICIIIAVLILSIIRNNPIGLSIILALDLIILLFISIKNIEVYNSYIKFTVKRLIPFFNYNKIVRYQNIKKIEFNKRQINYITLILPGVSSSIKDSEIVFSIKNDTDEKEYFSGNQKKLSTLYKIVSDRIEISNSQ